MAEPTGDFCAAYGCPMIGVYGVSGKWYCCCHHNADPALNDAITAELHRHKPLVDRVVGLRREYKADAKLEAELVELTRQIGSQATIHGAGVIGPEYAEPHYTEQEQ